MKDKNNILEDNWSERLIAYQKVGTYLNGILKNKHMEMAKCLRFCLAKFVVRLLEPVGFY